MGGGGGGGGVYGYMIDWLIFILKSCHSGCRPYFGMVYIMEERYEWNWTDDIVQNLDIALEITDWNSPIKKAALRDDFDFSQLSIFLDGPGMQLTDISMRYVCGLIAHACWVGGADMLQEGRAETYNALSPSSRQSPVTTE